MKISGTVLKIIYINDRNDFSVFLLDTFDGEIVCSGIVPLINVGLYLSLEGEIVYHDKYGEQFSFSNYIFGTPSDNSGVLNYLMSGVIPHIKEKMALKLVDHFGDDLPRVLNEEPERLLEINGIGQKKLNDILEVLEEQKYSRDTLIKLANLGITGKNAVDIYKLYGDDAIKYIEDNPYRLNYEIKGFGFKKADKVALTLGIKKDDPKRVEACIIYILESIKNEGHVFILEADLKKEFKRLFDLDVSLIDENIINLTISGKIVRVLKNDDYRVYLKQYYVLENLAATYTADRINDYKVFDHKFDKVFEEYFEKSSIRYDSIQKDACKVALTFKISIITGGPGTGKTSIIKAIIDIANKMNLNVSLAAPTGRAAKRMQEATGIEAFTLHRLLKIQPTIETNLVAEESIESDVLIVDEVSMIDMFMYANLLSALEDNTQLVLVGDKDQLPSIGCGNVLEDLINTKYIPTTVLKNIYRTSEGSDIAALSFDIKNGVLSQFNKNNSDIFFIECKTHQEVLEELKTLVKTRIPNHFKYDSKNDIQILSPSKKGCLGTVELNKEIQKLLISSSEKVEARNGVFRLGDKVMQLTNNYEKKIKFLNYLKDDQKGVFNGDVGIITEIDEDNDSIRVLFNDEYYTDYAEEDMNELQLSYVSTVHKSQGMEYPCVIFIAFDKNPFLNNKNLLYTAVTRSKELLIIIGKKEVYKTMLSNTFIQKRNTSLTEKIVEVVQIAEEMQNLWS